ncbi:MAG: MBL fold metallo-hydrolase [Candidatus Bathyarchaeota archaeon]|nr:MBL fold metallo-hydrolase [Candidatus Bathyarchaeota archaeon]
MGPESSSPTKTPFSQSNIKVYIHEEAETMLRKIKITPLAAESLGVRSMCTYVETPDLRILVDPGVSLCPTRFKLPPHPLEFKAIINARNKISKAAEKAEVITISHYHFDHHTPSFEDWLCNWTDTKTAKHIYDGKLVLAKNPRIKINASQRRRGWIFQKTGGKHVAKLKFADGKGFSFGETNLRFSKAVPHGSPNTPIGWVLMTTFDYGDERILFTSDVQGPMDNSTMQTIVNENPQLLIIGGPPLYLKGLRVGDDQIHQGLSNLRKLTRKIPHIIMDHHILRDSEWRNSTKAIFNTAQELGTKIVTAAGFLGKTDQLLEAKRQENYEAIPPSPEFAAWASSSPNRLTSKPPL